MAASLATVKLTEQQAEFVRYAVAGNQLGVAARLAGYSESIAEKPGVLLHSNAVLAAIRQSVTRQLVGEALPLAYNVLCEIARDQAAPAAVRRAAARDLMDRAGIVPPKAQDSTGDAPKALHEMSSDELRAYIDRIESELGARAVPVDNAQNPKPARAKPMAFLD